MIISNVKEMTKAMISKAQSGEATLREQTCEMIEKGTAKLRKGNSELSYPDALSEYMDTREGKMAYRLYLVGMQNEEPFEGPEAPIEKEDSPAEKIYQELADRIDGLVQKSGSALSYEDALSLVMKEEPDLSGNGTASLQERSRSIDICLIPGDRKGLRLVALDRSLERQENQGSCWSFGGKIGRRRLRSLPQFI
jgi:hypothetical protein